MFIHISPFLCIFYHCGDLNSVDSRQNSLLRTELWQVQYSVQQFNKSQHVSLVCLVSQPHPPLGQPAVPGRAQLSPARPIYSRFSFHSHCHSVKVRAYQAAAVPLGSINGHIMLCLQHTPHQKLGVYTQDSLGMWNKHCSQRLPSQHSPLPTFQRQLVY